MNDCVAVDLAVKSNIGPRLLLLWNNIPKTLEVVDARGIMFRNKSILRWSFSMLVMQFHFIVIVDGEGGGMDYVLLDINKKYFLRGLKPVINMIGFLFLRVLLCYKNHNGCLFLTAAMHSQVLKK